MLTSERRRRPRRGGGTAVAPSGVQQGPRLSRGHVLRPVVGQGRATVSCRADSVTSPDQPLSEPISRLENSGRGARVRTLGSVRPAWVGCNCGSDRPNRRCYPRLYRTRPGARRHQYRCPGGCVRYAVTQRSGAVHLRAQLEAPREVYALPVQLRSLHVTLISLAMNLPESYLPQ